LYSLEPEKENYLEPLSKEEIFVTSAGRPLALPDSIFAWLSLMISITSALLSRLSNLLTISMLNFIYFLVVKQGQTSR
jgi:hypothetical protein